MMKKLLFIPLFVLLMAGVAYADFVSNGDIDDEDMADISDWADADTGAGDSSQATFDDKSTMKLYTGVTTGKAERSQDIGTFGARTVFSLPLYGDDLGTYAASEGLYFVISNGSTSIYIVFGTDGLFAFNGAAYVEIGTDLVAADTWQEWTFDVDWTAQTMDVYLDKVLTASDVDVSHADEVANGLTRFAQYGGASPANRTSYIDWFKAGSDFVPAPPVVLSGQAIWW